MHPGSYVSNQGARIAFLLAYGRGPHGEPTEEGLPEKTERPFSYADDSLADMLGVVFGPEISQQRKNDARLWGADEIARLKNLSEAVDREKRHVGAVYIATEGNPRHMRIQSNAQD
jgi:hypothetical protein